MLADPNSKAIRDYHVLNTEAGGQFKGMARPGHFFIDAKGLIREKFFEAKYRERLSGNNIIAKLFPELGEEVINTVQAPHLEVSVQQSDRTGVPGSLITLITEVRLPGDIHVYAPGAKGYKSIELVIDSRPDLEFRPVIYPQSRILFMPAIDERVPVFEGTFSIRQDVKVSAAAEFSNSLGVEGKASRLTEHSATRRAIARRAFCPIPCPCNGSSRFYRSTGNAHLRTFDTSRSPQSRRTVLRINS